MISQFDKFVQQMFLEAANDAPAPEGGDAQAGPQNAQEGSPGEGEMPPPEDLAPEDPVFPEEIELAKLAIRANQFNISSKNVHDLKLRIDRREIPFEKVSDYFENTKRIIPILGFVEWAMDRYEGVSSKWSEQPEIRGKSITEKIKEFKKQLPPEQQLDNGKRLRWTRIIINALLHGSTNFNVTTADVNETTIKEIFRLLSQSFAKDTRGLSTGMDNMHGPATF